MNVNGLQKTLALCNIMQQLADWPMNKDLAMPAEPFSKPASISKFNAERR